MRPLAFALTLLMIIGLYSPMVSYGATTVSYKKLIRVREPNTCLLDNLINETRGVRGPGADRARVEIVHLVLSRRHQKNFAPTVCGVVHQRSHNPRRHRTWCEFSWICKPEHVEGLDTKLIQTLRRDIVLGTQRYRKYGPLKALYYTSDGTCPVKALRRYRKGAFTFCVSKK